MIFLSSLRTFAAQCPLFVDSGKNEKYTQIKFQLKAFSASKTNKNAQNFLKTLESEKKKLAEFYSLSDRSYNKLAVMSYGILGVESKFFNSFRYKIKELLPWAVPFLRPLRRDFFSMNSVNYLVEELKSFPQKKYSTAYNSRGPTQIKFMPPKLKKIYVHLKKENLSQARHAALATVAYLSESIPLLRHYERRSGKKIACSEYLDHLLFLYSGRAKEILGARASLENFQYYQKVKSYNKEIRLKLTGYL